MSSKKQEYANTYAALKPLGFTHADLADLHRYESQLQTINERQCNGVPDPASFHPTAGYRWNHYPDQLAAQDEAKIERIENRVRRLVARHDGVTVDFQGDPRGCAIRLLLPVDENGRRLYNSWDGESWVIGW